MTNLSERTLSILPARSRAKLEGLLIDRDGAHAAYRAASDAEQAARQEYGLAQGRYRDLASLGPGVGLEGNRFAKSELAEQEALEDRLAAPVEAARRRLDLAVAARERASERMDSFAFLASVEDWLERSVANGIGLQHCEQKAPRSRDPVAEVARLRAELEALDAQWSEAENAPVPAGILRQQAIDEINRVAAKGALTLNPRSRSGSPLGLERAIGLGMMRASGTAGPNLVGDAGAAVFTWLLRDQLCAEVEKMVAELPQEGAMSDDQQEAAFAKISARRLELERLEESLIASAAAEGRNIPRRRDADPRAILEVAET